MISAQAEALLGELMKKSAAEGKERFRMVGRVPNIIACQHCGTKISGTNRKFCGKKCRQNHHRKRNRQCQA